MAKKSFAKEFFDDIREEKADATRVEKPKVHSKVHEQYGNNDLLTAVTKGHKELNATGQMNSNEMKAKTENSRVNDAVKASGGDMDKAAKLYNKKFRHNLDANGDEIIDAEYYGKEPQRKDIKNGKDMDAYVAERKYNAEPTIKNALEAKKKKSFAKKFFEDIE